MTVRVFAPERPVVVVAGMVENMAGMVTGDTREFVVTIPESWETESLRGVPARCTVTVNEVFEWELPEVGTARVVIGLTHISRRRKIPRYNLLESRKFSSFDVSLRGVAIEHQNLVIAGGGSEIFRFLSFGSGGRCTLSNPRLGLSSTPQHDVPFTPDLPSYTQFNSPCLIVH